MIRLLLCVSLVLLATACGGDKEETHYTYAASRGCFKGIGITQRFGKGQNAVRITAGPSKTFDILFLPSGAQADAYTKRFKVPNGILHTRGNVIIYGHLTGRGEADVTSDEMDRVEECLA